MRRGALLVACVAVLALLATAAGLQAEPRRPPGDGRPLIGPDRRPPVRPRPPRGSSPPLRGRRLRVIPALLAVVLAGLALWILAPLRAPSRRMGGEGDARWKE